MTRTTLSTLAASLLLLAAVARAEPPAGAPPQDRSGTTIPGLRSTAGSRDPIQVERIEVVQETSWSLLLDVTYRYDAAPPAAEVKLFVLPDMPYWTTLDAKVAKGRNLARVNIGLYERKLKEDGRASFETSNLTVRFTHYAPTGFKGDLHQVIVPFSKSWKAR